MIEKIETRREFIKNTVIALIISFLNPNELFSQKLLDKGKNIELLSDDYFNKFLS